MIIIGSRVYVMIPMAYILTRHFFSQTVFDYIVVLSLIVFVQT